LKYALEVREDLTIRILIEFLRKHHIGKKAEEAAMTGAEQLREEGERRTLLKLLRIKFPILPSQTEKLIERSSHDKIENWTERILSATSLRDIFGDDLIINNAKHDND